MIGEGELLNPNGYGVLLMNTLNKTAIRTQSSNLIFFLYRHIKKISSQIEVVQLKRKPPFYFESVHNFNN
ncbi:hypothetical protein BpHYR1_047898 [Brachionus plicatilis]|uniref:Uncharacterized protein n=1 Tax=Brachionus plicatilis TaxID=10195 RepID=A0A3M7PH08_BRAPC|nr:hypothetical protein BpHYR1_047898 [Brachionus plicatilis]